MLSRLIPFALIVLGNAHKREATALTGQAPSRELCEFVS